VSGATYTELRALDGHPVRVKAKTSTFGTVESTELHVGDRISFSTSFIQGRGAVLAIDHGAAYPIKVEYAGINGDKRITSFTPGEFLVLDKESP